MEQWLPSKDFPMYDVSDLGRIRNSKTGRIKKVHPNRKGYLQTCLRRNNQQYTVSVHVIVAKAFHVDSYVEGYDVNHKDGNKLNCRADNLEWMTRADNIRHAIRTGLRKPHDARGMKNGRCKLTEDDVRYIRSHYTRGNKEFNGPALAKRFDVGTSTIYEILYRERWSNLE